MHSVVLWQFAPSTTLYFLVVVVVGEHQSQGVKVYRLA